MTRSWADVLAWSEFGAYVWRGMECSAAQTFFAISRMTAHYLQDACMQLNATIVCQLGTAYFFRNT